MTICRSMTLVKKLGAHEYAEPLKCRSWSCEYCAPDRRKRLIAEAIAGNPNTFLTLTVEPRDGQTPAERAVILAHAWRAVRRKLVAEGQNGTVPFLAVFEKTKLGEPHLHILLRSKWIEQRWLSSEMAAHGAGRVVWIERIKGASHAANYVAKYIGKDPHRFEGTKRYWSSRDYDQSEWEQDEERLEDGAIFEVLRCTLEEWEAAKIKGGFLVLPTVTGLAALAIGTSPALSRAPPPFGLRRPLMAACRSSQASQPATETWRSL